MLAVITVMSPTNRPVSASRRDTSHTCVVLSNVITMSAGWLALITELIGRVAGLEGQGNQVPAWASRQWPPAGPE